MIFPAWALLIPNRFDDAHDLTPGCRRPPFQGGLQGIFDMCSYLWNWYKLLKLGPDLPPKMLSA